MSNPDNKEKYPDIFKFLTAIAHGKGKMPKEIRRNIRWAINLIPIIGSFIDTNTFSRIDDIKTENDLDHLNSLCNKIMNSNASGILEVLDSIDTLITEIVSQLDFHSSVILKKINDENSEIYELLNDISSTLELAPWEKKEKKNKESSLLFLIAGPTCVGKDMVLSAVFNNCTSKGLPCELLKKFTTREKRHTDASYYTFLDSVTLFEEMKERGEIIMSYSKYGNWYGFNQSHLLVASQWKKAIFAVYTEIWHEQFTKMIESLNKQNIDVCSILFTATRNCVERRSSSRNITKDDKENRRERALREFDYIEKNKEIMKKQFTHIIDNSDAQTIESTINQVSNIVISTMYLKKTKYLKS